MTAKSLLVAVLLLLCHVGAQSQSSVFTISAETWGSAATNDSLRPLLSYSNEWGRYTLFDKTEFALEGGIDYRHTFRNPKLSIRTGLSAEYSTDADRTRLTQAYLDFHLFVFDLMAGKEFFTPVTTNCPTSLGSYLMSNNGCAVPRFWVGIHDYWSLPMPKFIGRDVLDIRGGISYGLIDNEGNSDYTDNAILHEKFAYARLALWRVKPYCGLYHSALMGGTMADGTKIPVDFWNTFFAKSGSTAAFGDSFRGEKTNVAGGHQGMWDYGFEYHHDKLNLRLYLQKPFATARYMNIVKRTFDYTIGALIDFKQSRIVKSIALEFMNTAYQGGEGTPDPFCPTQMGYWRTYFPGEVTDNNVRNIVENQLVQDDVAAWEAVHGTITTFDDFNEFAKQTYNHGLHYGGRALYLINYYYPQGWTYGGLSTGSAVMHTKAQTKKYAPEGTMPFNEAFSNISLRAYNVGVQMAFPFGLDALARATFTRNYGSYTEKYAGSSFSWTLYPNYFFESPRNEVYTKLDLRYRLPYGMLLMGNMAYDFGQMYHSFSARLGLRFMLHLISQ